jgi:hypothetical protein
LFKFLVLATLQLSKMIHNNFLCLETIASYRAEEGNILSPVEQENWRDKIIFPGGDHTVILDEEGFLSFLGTDPDFVLKGKHETKVNFPKFQKASNIKKALPFVGSSCPIFAGNACPSGHTAYPIAG